MCRWAAEVRPGKRKWPKMVSRRLMERICDRGWGRHLLHTHTCLDAKIPGHEQLWSFYQHCTSSTPTMIGLPQKPVIFFNICVATAHNLHPHYQFCPVTLSLCLFISRVQNVLSVSLSYPNSPTGLQQIRLFFSECEYLSLPNKTLFMRNVESGVYEVC